MSEQHNFWSLNIKFLRNRKKLTRDSLAELLGISHAGLRAYEQGRIPVLNDLLDLSGYFHVGIDTLLNVNLSALPDRAVQALQSGDDLYITGNKVRGITAHADGMYAGAGLPRKDRSRLLSRFRRYLRKQEDHVAFA